MGTRFCTPCGEDEFTFNGKASISIKEYKEREQKAINENQQYYKYNDYCEEVNNLQAHNNSQTRQSKTRKTWIDDKLGESQQINQQQQQSLEEKLQNKQLDKKNSKKQLKKTNQISNFGKNNLQNGSQRPTDTSLNQSNQRDYDSIVYTDEIEDIDLSQNNLIDVQDQQQKQDNVPQFGSEQILQRCPN